MDRRSFLSLSAGAAVAPALASPTSAQQVGSASEAKRQSKLVQLAGVIATNRMPIDFDGGHFSGLGYDWLLRRGQAAHAFLLGEEHGIAENPKLAAQLFSALVPSGYAHVVVEISPPMADVLDDVALTGGSAALRKALADPDTRVAFFGLEEEADWFARARAAVPSPERAIWGIDYEVIADRHLIHLLKERPKPAAATAALARLEAASNASWAHYNSTRNPQFIFSFAGDPKLVRSLASAWPDADSKSRLILDTLEQTLTINALYGARKNYESNLARSRFMRSNLLRYWKEGERHGTNARLFMKMGAAHLTRGLSMTDVFDVGTLVPELVAERGGESFHLLVLPGPGTQTANMDPTQLRYLPGNRNEYGEGMDLFDQAIIPGKFTLFDTAPLRPIASSESKDVPLPLWRVIHGFDAVMIMTGSHPSSNIQ